MKNILLRGHELFTNDVTAEGGRVIPQINDKEWKWRGEVSAKSFTTQIKYHKFANYFNRHGAKKGPSSAKRLRGEGGL